MNQPGRTFGWRDTKVSNLLYSHRRRGLPWQQPCRTVEEIGKKERYTLIMERKVGGVMYAPSAIDITDKVIRKLNALEQKKE